MARFTYKPQGVCSVEISFDIDNDIVSNVKFVRGCAGNTAGICRLVDGMPVDYVISKLKGTDCNGRGTSCPDQLALALEASKNQQ